MSGMRGAIAVRLGLLSLAVCLLAGCGHEAVRRVHVPAEVHRSPTNVVSQPAATQLGVRAAAVATQQIGVPYRFGGTTTRGFDCSGLAQFAYAAAGRRIPRTTAAQWRALDPVPGGSIRVGDLLFFRIGGAISHVGIYLGDRKFVHAPASGRRVSIERLDSPFYRQAYAGAARPGSPSG